MAGAAVDDPYATLARPYQLGSLTGRRTRKRWLHWVEIDPKQTILKSFRRRLLAGGGYVHSSHQASAALLMIEATTSGFDT